jgi:hypothetical protein
MSYLINPSTVRVLYDIVMCQSGLPECFAFISVWEGSGLDPNQDHLQSRILIGIVSVEIQHKQALIQLSLRCTTVQWVFIIIQKVTGTRVEFLFVSKFLHCPGRILLSCTGTCS